LHYFENRTGDKLTGNRGNRANRTDSGLTILKSFVIHLSVLPNKKAPENASGHSLL
jgi:hypothetical protein